MKKWSFTLLLMIVLVLLPSHQVKWSTEASSSETVLSKSEPVLHNAPDIEIEQQKASTATNSFMPKVNRNYSYEPSFETNRKTTYTAKRNASLNNSVELLEDDYIGYTYLESEHDLSFGIAYSDVFFFSLPYPMIENTTINDSEYSSVDLTEIPEVFVESTTATVTTKAGTFQDVVIIKYTNGAALYLAKDYGIIRITDFAGNITTELVSVNEQMR